MKRKTGWIKRFCCLLLIGSMVFPPSIPAGATSKAEKEKKEAQQKLDEANRKAQEAEENKSAVQNQVKQLNSELTALLSDLQILETDMSAKETQIVQAEIDYEAAKKTEERQYDSMKKRIQYMYEQGDTEYLDVLFQVKSMADLLNKAEYMTDIYTYDRKQLETYRLSKQQVADTRAQLEDDKSEMEVMEQEYKSQQKQLETTIANKRQEVSDFDVQFAKAKEDAAAHAKTVEQKNAQIRKAQEEAAKEEARRKAAEEAAKKAAPSKGNQPAKNTYTGPSAVKSSGGTAKGREIADYGLKFVGNPYVFGGTSLTNGADCSGFTGSVYRDFGISIPRTSLEQRSAGREVAYADAQPGDLICYSGHVGIYIGNGKIVHASTPSSGIKVSTATYRTILSVRRIIG